MTPLIIVIVSLLLSGFFSGMEIAFVSSSKVRAEMDIARGGLVNKMLNVFFSNREMFISTLLVGNNNGSRLELVGLLSQQFHLVIRCQTIHLIEV